MSRFFLIGNIYFITVVFPQDLLENGLTANNFAMLGLGDIVIPGIFIALLLRFDCRYLKSLFSSYSRSIPSILLGFLGDSLLFTSSLMVVQF